jgi:single stranded DNA-binding protein
MSQNYVRISGGITRDPDQGFSPGGWAYWRTTLAVNGTKYNSETRKQEAVTKFILVSAIGYPAERLIEENLCKGEELLVEGELDQREWTNKESQKQEHRTQVDLQQYTVLRRRQGGGQTSARPAAVVQPRPEDDPWANNSPDSEPPF